MAKTYRIVRFFQNGWGVKQVIARGKTLNEAKTWCTNPETSSRTATTPDAVARTQKHGPWFDGFEEEAS